MHTNSKRACVIVMVVLLSLFFLNGLPWAAQTTTEKKTASSELQPKAVFPESRWEFESILEGAEIKHDFIIENHGKAVLLIKNVRPD